MPRPKGLPKTGGRKKGTPNKPKLPVSRAVPGNVVVVTNHEALGKLGGSQSEAWNDAIALQVVNALWLKDPAARHKQASAMLVGLNGISPRDELEGMMVAQLITAHNAVMECYRRESSLAGRPRSRVTYDQFLSDLSVDTAGRAWQRG
jgi:hypothetical protein